ncbi:exonuclease 1-like isoform X2 [Hydractinia symbiolongicarpus]|uniref:exonuclease 1-like isoform X2 n=1 Tax=Hydractinia symbiolongicarpus TaxID=13093 RepID=UPI00254D6D3F|nr:exonuclease 1-like isoform X2 [Hydractinia symbiolongicarpus]
MYFLFIFRIIHITMGIQGLLPLLKDIQVKTSMSNFKGQTVGIDAYCWLHKGAYGCAKDLVLGQPTKVYIHYVVRRLNMLINNGVTPIMVFDGGYLPAKSEKEKERRAKRKEYRSRGIAALREGKSQEAFENFQKCCDITPQMASEVIKECCTLNVKCIVAPYEADAQLAYLMKEGITQLTISEDSDLLLYGCHRVLYKMTPEGEGMLVDLENLSKVRTVQLSSFTFEKFRQMCMLSGCDYLPSIKGMGLVKAHKALRRHSSAYQCIRALKCDTSYHVPPDYLENFRKAEMVFKYQLVFDPRSKRVVPLNAMDSQEKYTAEELKYAGPKIDDHRALQIALGNIDPITNNILADRTDFASGLCKNIKKDTGWLAAKKTTQRLTSTIHTKRKPLSLCKLDTAPERVENCLKPNSLSPVFQATKSLKRLREDDSPSPEKEIKLQKLYNVVQQHSTEEDDSISPPQKSSLSVFKKSHKFRNPFRQTAETSPTKKIVLSRYFNSKNDQNDEKISPTICNDDLESSPSTLPKSSFIDCLDQSNFSAMTPKRKKALKTPTKSIYRQSKIPSLCSPESQKKEDLHKKNRTELNRKPLSPIEVNKSSDENIDFKILHTVEDDKEEGDVIIYSPVKDKKPAISKTLCKSKISLGLSKYYNQPKKSLLKTNELLDVKHERPTSDCGSPSVLNCTNVEDNVIYLDEGVLPRLPQFNEKGKVPRQSLTRPVSKPAKANMSNCRPIGLSKRHKPLPSKGNVLKQSKLSLEKFAFKTKSIERYIS